MKVFPVDCRGIGLDDLWGSLPSNDSTILWTCYINLVHTIQSHSKTRTYSVTAAFQQVRSSRNGTARMNSQETLLGHCLENQESELGLEVGLQEARIAKKRNSSSPYKWEENKFLNLLPQRTLPASVSPKGGNKLGKKTNKWKKIQNSELDLYRTS